jgi:hypothetical protein
MAGDGREGIRTPYRGKLLKTLHLEYWCRRGDSQTLLFYAAFQVFLIFLSILTLCVIALFTPFVLTGLFCDSDVTPSFQDALYVPREIKVRVGRRERI